MSIVKDTGVLRNKGEDVEKKSQCLQAPLLEVESEMSYMRAEEVQHEKAQTT